MAPIEKAKWGDFWQYFANQPQQVQAVGLLYDQIPASLIEDDEAWVLKYRETPPAPKGKITPELMNQITGYPATSFNEDFCSGFNDLLQVTGFAKQTPPFQNEVSQTQHQRLILPPPGLKSYTFDFN